MFLSDNTTFIDRKIDEFKPHGDPRSGSCKGYLNICKTCLTQKLWSSHKQKPCQIIVVPILSILSMKVLELNYKTNLHGYIETF